MRYEEDEDGIRVIEEYNASLSRKVTFIVLMTVAIVIVICLSGSAGGRHIDVMSIPGIIWDHIMGATYQWGTQEWWDDYVLVQVRMPRILISCVAGATLAICGAAVQSLMSNPIASPYTMGISSGAGFGATLAIILGFSLGNVTGMYGITFNSFVFGMIPVVVILMISRVVRMTPVTLILIGVAISQFFGSLTSLIYIGAEEGGITAAYLWEIGSIVNVKWADLPFMAAMLVIGGTLLYLASWKFNVIAMGEDSAKTMGVDANKFRLITMCLLALMTMSVVSFVGIIGFVGLIAPHVVRSVIGSDNRFVMPASLVGGALLLLCADSVARLGTSDLLPVGTVISLIGAPVFIYLILRRNSQFKGAW
ncbi:MAG: iron ABC transporter permease [Candidatus Methanomethylophilaceae archaeon]|nr:iron ABC transporter permease [Candidatus Methanomethylophilaceae archaeon]